VEKVSIELQPVVRTLLGVELGRKNIIACNGGGKALAVFRLAGAVESVRRLWSGTPAHTGCGRVCTTWFQPICGTL
jgi:hypothetical protein